MTNMKKERDYRFLDEMRNDPSNYLFGVFYFNRNRIFFQKKSVKNTLKAITPKKPLRRKSLQPVANQKSQIENHKSLPRITGNLSNIFINVL